MNACRADRRQDIIASHIALIQQFVTNLNLFHACFPVFVKIETGADNYYEILICNQNSPTKIQKDFLIPCSLDIDTTYSFSYNNVYLTRYTVPVEDSNPFQVIIEKDLKAEDYDDADDEVQKFSDSIYINFNLSLFILFVIYLLFEF